MFDLTRYKVDVRLRFSPKCPKGLQVIHHIRMVCCIYFYAEDVKSLGSEVLNQLREVVGTGKFVNVYNSVRESVKENRDKRKTAQKISVLVDPERNAKRKIKMSAKRQAQKKRKVIHAKRLMGL